MISNADDKNGDMGVAPSIEYGGGGEEPPTSINDFEVARDTARPTQTSDGDYIVPQVATAELPEVGDDLVAPGNVNLYVSLTKDKQTMLVTITQDQIHPLRKLPPKVLGQSALDRRGINSLLKHVRSLKEQMPRVKV